jgi:exosortase/archaeosortase family protein
LFGLLPPRDRPERPHPYRHEETGPAERSLDARFVTLLWLLASATIAWAGWAAAAAWGYVDNQSTLHADWDAATGLILAVSLGLLAVGLWSPLPEEDRSRIRFLGWILFAGFWALTARDLFVREGADYVNATAAIAVGTFGGTYVAYHEWLNVVRRSRDFATRFLSIVAVLAAGTYFIIARITPARLWLIETVGVQTKWSLDLFGFGAKMGLQFHVDKQDPWGPVLFHYPDTYCDAGRSDPIGPYCAGLPEGERFVATYGGGVAGASPAPVEPTGWFDSMLLYAPDGDLRIIPVSIILACTAIQSIMLFVGLFMGTRAPLRQKLAWSAGVGALIYVLNLLRNTLVIWAYGRGHSSFFFMHNIVAKVLTLGALVGIALVAFKRMPAFLDALGAVLDMPHRDGPIERTLRLGRRRPGPPGQGALAAAGTAATSGAAAPPDASLAPRGPAPASHGPSPASHGPPPAPSGQRPASPGPPPSTERPPSGPS